LIGSESWLKVAVEAEKVVAVVVAKGAGVEKAEVVERARVEPCPTHLAKQEIPPAAGEGMLLRQSKVRRRGQGV
jgi:hypothetical protein